MSLKIVITLEEDGRIGVEGQIQDEIITFGLLKKAEQTLIKFYQKRTESKIIQPKMAFMPTTKQ